MLVGWWAGLSFGHSATWRPAQKHSHSAADRFVTESWFILDQRRLVCNPHVPQAVIDSPLIGCFLSGQWNLPNTTRSTKTGGRGADFTDYPSHVLLAECIASLGKCDKALFSVKCTQFVTSCGSRSIHTHNALRQIRGGNWNGAPSSATAPLRAFG